MKFQAVNLSYYNLDGLHERHIHMYPKGTNRLALSVDVSVINKEVRQPVSLRAICIRRLISYRFKIGVRRFFEYVVRLIVKRPVFPVTEIKK